MAQTGCCIPLKPQQLCISIKADVPYAWSCQYAPFSPVHRHHVHTRRGNSYASMFAVHVRWLVLGADPAPQEIIANSDLSTQPVVDHSAAPARQRPPTFPARMSAPLQADKPQVTNSRGTCSHLYCSSVLVSMLLFLPMLMRLHVMSAATLSWSAAARPH